MGATAVSHLAARCYTPDMPTLRPRYTVTESDELARALGEVARAHPELDGDRNAQFRQLVAEATARYDRAREVRLERMRVALGSIAALGLSYPPGYLDGLRAEWPE